MKTVKHTILRGVSVFLVSAVLVGSLAACASDEETIEVRQAFNQALLDEDYSEAQRIYEKSSYQEGFDAANYIQMISNRLDQLRDRFQNNIVTYDQAVVQMEQLMFMDEVEAALGEKRREILVSMNAQVAEGARKSLAAELSNMDANREAIRLYQDILIDTPDDAEATRGLQQATNSYVGEVQQEVATLRGGRYINQALELVRASLRVVPQHQDLINLQSGLEEDRRNADLTLDTRRALVEIRQYMSQNMYEDALLMIRATLLEPTYQDKQEELQELENQVMNIIMTANLRRASAVTPGQDLAEIHWEARPYDEALAIVREGLQILPENETMLQAEAYYAANLPYNFRDFVRFERGRQQSLPEGTSSFGYTYPSDRNIFNIPLYVIGATQLVLDNNEDRHESAPWNTLRLVISPEGDPIQRNYQNYQLEIKSTLR